MSEVFKKVKEDFVCGHCGEAVVGNGYTNHCPKCLWSRHVDINPGDRAEGCLGLMRPESVIFEHDEYFINHVCELCGAKRRVKAASSDDISGFLTHMLQWED